MPPISPAHRRDSNSSSERVAACVDHLAQGGIVIVTDDEDRENEGDLIMVADHAGPADLAFFLQHTSGVVCASLSGERLDQLALPLMVEANDESFGTAFTVTVDLADGVTTGISALDRARTLRALSDPASVSTDFVRPGHVFPLRAHPGGVLGRPGHTEAAWDLSRMAGGNAGVLCEVVSPDRTRMANGDELTALAIEHDLPMISIAELVQYRQVHDTVVDLASSAAIATEHGEFVCQAWRGRLDGVEHIALVRGDVSDGRPVLVRVHSECLTGDVFGSRRCDCGSQLDDALAMIDQAGRGVVVYLRGHEGRGIGLTQKLRAYELQDQGLDTVDANLELGLAVDAREYGIGAQILRQLGVHAMRLMTNNPDKGSALAGLGLEVVEHVPLPPRVTAQNLTYLRTKRDRMAHDLPGLDLPGTTPAP